MFFSRLISTAERGLGVFGVHRACEAFGAQNKELEKCLTKTPNSASLLDNR
jgi:hypothetical protein